MHVSLKELCHKATLYFREVQLIKKFLGRSDYENSIYYYDPKEQW